MNIVVIATLDTKGKEVEVIKRTLQAKGKNAYVVDCSLIGEAQTSFDVSRHEVLAHAGEELATLLAAQDKNRCINAMQTGVDRLLQQLYKQGKLSGVLSVGGVQGSVIASKGMQNLPVLVPKFLVSTVANSKTTFGPFVGCSDMAIMHSVVDISGTNHILDTILEQAACAVAAMVDVQPKKVSAKTSVGITMAGVTTACVTRIKELLEQQDFEVIVFHCNGIGAKAMEQMVARGEIDAVMDITPHDMTDYLIGGMMPCEPTRIDAVVQKNIPYFFAPGCADLIVFNGMANVPQSHTQRKYVCHNDIHTHVKTSYKDMQNLARFLLDKVDKPGFKSTVLIPQRGFSQLNAEGGPLYDPQSDSGFTDTVSEASQKNSNIKVVRSDTHINDDEFAELCVKELLARL